MKTLTEIYDEIAVTAGARNSDKGSAHSYIEQYEKLLAPYRNKEINFLEVGINYGWSMALWRQYFPKAKVFGIDIVDEMEYHDENVTPLFGDGSSKGFIEDHFGNMKFDIVIDDANHEIDPQLTRFPIYFERLNKGGVYIIEDIQNLNASRDSLLKLHPKVEILDLRNVKNRYDDVLVVIKKD